MKKVGFCLMILFIAGIVFCDETTTGVDPQPTNPLEFIPTWIYPVAIPILTALIVYFFNVRPRRKRKTMYRKSILTEVDLIAKAYSGKMEKAEIDVIELMSRPNMPSTIKFSVIHFPVPQSDLDNFHNLQKLYMDATSLLSPAENNMIHDLLDAFQKAIYNKIDGESRKGITLDKVYNISVIANQLQTLLKTNISVKDNE